MQKRLTEKYSTEVAKYCRIYRDLVKLKVLSSTDVKANSSLLKNIQKSSKDLNEVNVLLLNANNKVFRDQNQAFTRRFSSLIAEQEKIDNEIADIKMRINHLKSQVDCVDIQLEKYSTLDNQFNADKKIEILESRLLRNNQKVNDLRLHGLKLKEFVSNLLFMRHQFQKSRDNVIAKLIVKKEEIMELVDHYAIGFANGMKNCQNLKACRIRSAKELKIHLQEIRQLIRTAVSDNILRKFMITKATPIQLETNAVPPREILMSNYRALMKTDEELLAKINEFASGISASDLKAKVREAFSLYLYSNDITKMIDNSAKSLEMLENQTNLAEIQLKDRELNEEREIKLENQWTDEANETQVISTNLVDKESLLEKCFIDIAKMFEMLQCEDSLLYEVGQSVDAYNVHNVLQLIETRLRHVMHTVYCWQEKKKKKNTKDQLVYGTEIVKAHGLPALKLVHSCAECSQSEARANIDVETIFSKGDKEEKIKFNIKMKNLKAKMHAIEKCPKPASKAILSKNL